MGKREKLSEQTGSPSTTGETFLRAAGQYAGLEDDGFFINHEAPASQGGTMPTLFSTTGLDVMETGKAPALTSGGFYCKSADLQNVGNQSTVKVPRVEVVPQVKV